MKPSPRISMAISRNGQELLVRIPIQITSRLLIPERGKLDTSRLSRKELKITEELFRGKVRKEIASEMNIAVRTVSFHLANIYRKFQVNNCRELLALGEL